MEEPKKKELYNNLLQIAEGYKDIEPPQWSADAKEEISRILMQLCEKSSEQGVFHLEPAAKVTEETKHLLEEFKERINYKPFIIDESIDTTLNVEDIKIDTNKLDK